jgi:hypothetical protein
VDFVCEMASSKRRRLRLLVREDEDWIYADKSSTSNLFVRLSPGVPRDLIALARSVPSIPNHDLSSGVPDHDLSWTLNPSAGNLLSNDDDDPTFLPLCIVFDKKDDGRSESEEEAVIYASYNGGFISGRKANAISEGMSFPTD